MEKGTTELAVTLTPKVEIHPLPDDPDVVAFTYGPLVLSAGLGSENMVTMTFGANVTVPVKERKIKDTLEIKKGSIEEWRQKPEQALVRQGDTLNFMLAGTDEDKNLVFSQHYARFEERYGIYWKLTKGKKQEVRMPEKSEMMENMDKQEKKRRE